MAVYEFNGYDLANATINDFTSTKTTIYQKADAYASADGNVNLSDVLVAWDIVAGAVTPTYAVKDAQGNAVAVANAYIARRIEAWMPEYMPEEFPKMEAASVKIFGNYVVYAILSEDVKADVFDAVKAELTEK